jgi:hypothetical protein
MRSAFDGFAKVFGAEAESLMMDRHDEMSAGSLAICTACSGLQCVRRQPFLYAAFLNAQERTGS